MNKNIGHNNPCHRDRKRQQKSNKLHFKTSLLSSNNARANVSKAPVDMTLSRRLERGRSSIDSNSKKARSKGSQMNRAADLRSNSSSSRSSAVMIHRTIYIRFCFSINRNPPVRLKFSDSFRNMIISKTNQLSNVN